MPVLDPKLAHEAAATQGWWNAWEGFKVSERTGKSIPFTAEGTGPGSFERIERGRWAYPVMRAAGDGALGPVLSTLFSTHKTIYCAACFHSITSDESTIQHNEALWCREGTLGHGLGLFVRNVGGSGSDYRAYAANRDSGGWLPTPGIQIQLGVWYVIAVWHNSTTLKIAVDDFRGNVESVLSGASTGLAGNLLLGRNWQSSPKYCNASIGELFIRSNADTDENGETIFAYFKSGWGNRGDAIETARRFGSRRARSIVQVPRAPVIVTPRLDLLDLSIGDRVAVQCDRYPHRNGAAGALRLDQDQRPELRISRLVLDGDKKELAVRALDTRERDCGCYLRFDPPQAPSPWNDGPTIMLPPDAWFHDLAGYPVSSPFIPLRYLRRAADGLVDTVFPDQWGVEPEGLLVERNAHQTVLNPFFVGGTANWNPSNGGSGLTPTTETTEGIFWATARVTQLNMVLEQDPTPTVVKSISQTYSVSDEQTFSLWHRDDAGAILKWRRQRAFDGYYWNDTTGAWQAAPFDNLLPESGAGTIARFTSKPILHQTSTTNHTDLVFQDTGGAGSRKNRLYCVQAEGGFACPGYAGTSPILGSTSALYRPYRRPAISAAADHPVVFPTRGTILVAYKPLTTAGRNPTQTHGAFHAETAADDIFAYWDPSTETWEAWAGGGSGSSAGFPLTSFQDGSYHFIAVRYAGDSAAEDLAADTFDIIADGVKGSPGAFGGFAAADQLLTLGVMPGSQNCLDGHLRVVETKPRVFSAEECVAWGRRHCK